MQYVFGLKFHPSEINRLWLYQIFKFYQPVKRHLTLLLTFPRYAGQYPGLLKHSQFVCNLCILMRLV